MAWLIPWSSTPPPSSPSFTTSPAQPSLIPLLPGSLLSSVNLAEIHIRLLIAGRPAPKPGTAYLSMGFEVVPFSEEQARLAGELFEELARNSRSRALSLGERACLALAIERKATVYTTNRAWKDLSAGSRCSRNRLILSH